MNGCMEVSDQARRSCASKPVSVVAKYSPSERSTCCSTRAAGSTYASSVQFSAVGRTYRSPFSEATPKAQTVEAAAHTASIPTRLTR